MKDDLELTYSQRYYREHKAEFKEYYERNRERIRLVQKRYRERNLEKRRRQSNEWKASHKKEVKEYYQKNKQRFQEYQQEYWEDHREQSNENSRKWRARHPEKVKAENLAYRKVAVDNQCAICGSKENLHRHHPDYSKPLEIVTLCYSCHFEVHANPSLLEALK